MLNTTDQHQLFEELFSFEVLIETFDKRYLKSSLRGYDGLTGRHLRKNCEPTFDNVSIKCLSKIYRFTPYKEKLIIKNRNSKPRIVGIPTVRDRVVLKQLNTFLLKCYGAQRIQQHAKVTIHSIIEHIDTLDSSNTWIYAGDIKGFFDNIPHQQLLDTLKKTIKVDAALALIEHALLTPILPVNTSKKSHSKFKPQKGVAQGISIAGTLANIYLLAIDQQMRAFNEKVYYSRYVDDILLIGEKDDLLAAKIRLENLMLSTELELHGEFDSSGKNQLKPLNQPFQYLGYFFELPNKISVRESSIARLIQRLSKLFAEANTYSKSAFLFKLNIRITGLIRDNQYIGWLAYYNKITDLTLLYQLDAFVKQQCLRSKIFDYQVPSELKSFVRAYHESRHSLYSGYIQNDKNFEYDLASIGLDEEDIEEMMENYSSL